MTKYQSEFMQVMQERGFIHQCTDAKALDTQLAAGRVTAYIGFDCTAPSLHAGSLIQIMALRWLQKTGHRPVALLGGATTRVGDPSGKDEARRVLTEDEIRHNTTAIAETLQQFLAFGTSNRDALMVNNEDWLLNLNYLDFLQNVARHFSVNRMLTQDSVKLRLEREQNLSLLEFNYMVLQAYDFVELHKRYDCNLQIGGSDQWGNIVMGIDLNRRLNAERRFTPMGLDMLQGNTQVLEIQPMIHSKHGGDDAYKSETFAKHLNDQNEDTVFGLTTPLLTNSSGQKMGKTASGAVWLHKDMLTAYDYWQYWRNVDDADVGRFLRLFTELPLDEIKKLESLRGAEINEAKKILATQVTALCHGDRAARQAASTAQKTFEQGETAEDLPQVEIDKETLGKGLAAYELFRISELVDSGGEAKRLIRGGGAKINDRKVTDENELIPAALFHKAPVKLTAGKKRHLLVKLV